SIRAAKVGREPVFGACPCRGRARSQVPEVRSTMPDPGSIPHTFDAAAKIAGDALSFDDVLLVPRFSDVHPRAVETRTTLVRGIELQIPIASSAMDTVSEARLCVALAREGGIGFIHKNLAPEAQAAQVDLVKRSESGMITDPVSLPPTATVQDALDLMAKFRFSGVPIVEGRKLVGILTNRDLRFVEDTRV